MLYRQAYAASFNDRFLVPNWVCYTLKADNLGYSTKRTDDFRPDPELPVGKRAELTDYKGSGYDRGHMAPAADMKQSKTTMSESFLLSNMSPQVPNLNRGIWSSLEDDVRTWVSTRRVLYICTGPIFLDNNHDGKVDSRDHKTIGADQVAVPDEFFKIVYSPAYKNAISFILANKTYQKGTPLSAFIVSVDDIERLTGLDFLSGLDDNTENRVESERTGALWN